MVKAMRGWIRGLGREEIPSGFVGQFKVGDNIAYNSKVLCSLVETNDRGRFNKPIVLQVASLIEACMNQLVFRAKNFTIEGVPEISSADIAAISAKKIDKLNTMIDVFKKYRILDGLGDGLYDDLHKVRRCRNKIHIQESVEGLPEDEDKIFSDVRCSWAVSLGGRTIRHISERYPRPEHINGYVQPIHWPPEQSTR